MIGLTAKELTAIRNDINDLLPDIGYILSRSATSDGMGGQTETWGTAGTTTCRLDPKTSYQSGKEEISAGALNPFHSFVLTMPYDTTITTENRFKLGTITYNVISVDIDKSWRASVRAYLERI